MEIENYFKRITKFSGLVAGLTLSPAAKVAAIGIPLSTVAIVTATLVGSPVPVDRTPATPVIAASSLDAISVPTELPVLSDAADAGSDNTSALVAMADQNLSAFSEEVVQPDALPITTSSAPSRRFARVMPQLASNTLPVVHDEPPCLGEGCVPPKDKVCEGEGCVPPKDKVCEGEGCVPPKDKVCEGEGCVPPKDKVCEGEGCVPPKDTVCVGAGCNQPDTDCSDGSCVIPVRTALPDVVAVPEPETLALLGVGLLGMGWFRRKR